MMGQQRVLKNLTSALLVTLVLGLTACSTYYRESQPTVSSEELAQIFSEIQSNVASDSVMSALNFNDVSTGNSMVVYHTSELVGRPATSVLSVEDMSLLDASFVRDTSSLEIGLYKIDVIFVDNVAASGDRTFTLMIKMQFADGSPDKYDSFSSNAYSFTDSDFSVIMRAANGDEMIIHSDDLSDKFNEQLADSVKLNILVHHGTDLLVGQISTMAGFGNR